jgi:hypothetical protein
LPVNENLASYFDADSVLDLLHNMPKSITHQPDGPTYAAYLLKRLKACIECPERYSAFKTTAKHFIYITRFFT